MRQQQKLWLDDIYDAIGSVIQELGGYNKVAGWLWPAKKRETAYAQLKNSLRDDKAEKLAPEEVLLVLRWGRAIGCHTLMDYLTDEACYHRADPLEPQDDEHRLQEAFVRSIEEQKKLVEQFESLQSKLRVGDPRKWK